MSSRLRLGTTVLLLLTAIAAAEGWSVGAKEAGSQAGIALQTILETEHTARLLAVLLDSGRSVINEHQALVDEPRSSDKGQGLTPDVFDRQLAEMFRSRSGIDLQDLSSSRISAQAKTLIKELVAVSRQVVADAQPEINRSSGPRGLLPAIYGARVASRFTERTGVRMKQTTLEPRNAANAPDTTERAALELFADPGYPREKPVSETTAKSGILRLMVPLYTTRHCLDCHGEPKGVLDRTGYPREGWKLGQNAGAISVMIPIAK